MKPCEILETGCSQKREWQQPVEFSDWAYVCHGWQKHKGVYRAHEKTTHKEIGHLIYVHLSATTIMIQHLETEEEFMRRRVATGLLRFMHLDNPEAKINPGTRSVDGTAFFHHVERIEPELFHNFGVHNIPLYCMLPSEFWPQVVARQNFLAQMEQQQ